MTDEQRVLKLYSQILKVMELHRRSLAEAGADPAMLDVYSSVIRHLSHLPKDRMIETVERKKSSNYASKIAALPLSDVASMSVQQIDKLLNDKATPRKILEAIAVGKFHFPRGSLRSLSNSQALRDKIRTMRDSERSHQTILDVARRTKN